MKGEEYEKGLKDKREIFILSMRYHVFGAQSMTKKEMKSLKKAGIIKLAKSRFAQILEE